MPSGWPENDGVSLDPRHPKALGICDYCGRTYHLMDLKDQWEFGGFGLINLHFRVCQPCMDKPQPQLKSLVLPPDPIPALNPRPEIYSLDNQLQGFMQQFVITPPLNPVLSYAQITSLAVSQGWGAPQPALTDYSGTITSAFTSQQILAAGGYVYLLIYNPSAAEIGVSLSVPANFNSPTTTTQIGGGTALYQIAANGQSVWQGPILACSTQPNSPIIVAAG